MNVKYLNDRGEIRISEGAIAKMAERVALSTYGVAGISKVKGFFSKQKPIAVKTVNNAIHIDMQIDVSCCENVAAICESVRYNTKHFIESIVNYTVGSVSVFVNDLIDKGVK